MRRFGEKVEKWKGKVSDFSAYKEDVQDVLGLSEITKRIYPKDPLTAMTLLSLDPALQEIAQALIQRREASSDILGNETSKSEFIARMQLEELVELGHIGRTMSGEDYIYFTQ